MSKQPPVKKMSRMWCALFVLLLQSSVSFADIISAACNLPTPAQQRLFVPLITESVQPNPTANPASWGLVTLDKIPPGYSVVNGNYVAWCVDANIGITPGTVYNPIMYDTYDIAGLNSIAVPTAGNVWNKINYILNNKPPGANATTIQAAIWRFTNPPAAAQEPSMLAGSYLPQFGFQAADLATINAIVAAANANGASFVPGPGQITAVYLQIPVPPNPIVRQPVIIEVLCPTPTGSIGNFVWNDLNANGIQEPNEPGIDGVTVTLKDGNGMVIDTMVTANNGFYQFTDLFAGTYFVTVDTTSPALSGLVASPTNAAGSTTATDSNPTPETVVLATDSSSDQTIDFGYYAFVPPTGQIGNFVWKDLNQDGIQTTGEPGINGVKVTLKDGANNILATTLTAGNGAYLFSGLVAGNYVVEVDTSSLALAGCIPTIPNAPGSNSANDSNPNGDSVVLAFDSAVDLTIDFGYIPAPAGSIGDFVWKDLDGDGIQGIGEPGIPNVTVRLFNGLVLLATTMTDMDGLYLFTGLSAGTYTVAVDNASPNLAGCVPTTPNASGSTTTNDSNPNPSTVVLPLNTSSDTSIDFGYTEVPAGQIGNFVWKDLDGDGIQDTGEPGINGVTVRLLSPANVVLATQVTAGNGAYLFTGLRAGSYTVAVDNASPALAGCTPTTTNAPGSTTANDSNSNPSPVTLLTNSSTDLTVDFGYIAIPSGSIGDFVWKDLDGDGIQDTGEPGINGVTVKLLSAANVVLATQVTAGNGAYLFTGLKAGTYTVMVDTTSPALTGCVPTTTNAPGSTTSNDSNGSPATVTLATNSSSNLTIDFGYKTPTPPPSPLTTYTMGGWGASPSGNNPGTFLAANFATVYPAGLTVGGGFTLKFTSAKGIENFLPCGGTAAKLSQSYINPTTKLGVLAGQVVALRLGVDFSNAGVTAGGLASAKFKTGKFAGQTVGQVLALAESVLGGATLPTGISYSDLSNACTLVNENYDAGVNKGNLIP